MLENEISPESLGGTIIPSLGVASGYSVDTSSPYYAPENFVPYPAGYLAKQQYENWLTDPTIERVPFTEGYTTYAADWHP